MAPPSYADLGKNARDVFNKGYNFGVWKLDVKTKTDTGVEFSTSGHSNQETGKVFGSLETKYKVPEYGLTFTEKWNTDNTLFTDVTHNDKFLKGLKLTFEGTFAPQSGNKTGKVKASYGHDLVQVNSDVNLDLAGPVINASAVVGYEGWLAGYQTAFDTQKTKLVTNNFALAYTNKELAVTTTVKDGQEFNGSIFHKVNDDLNAGVQLAWTSGSNATKFGIGAQYSLDKNSSVRAKISNDSLIGLGFQTKIRPGVLLALSTLVDGKNFNSGGHKVGIALELEA